MIGRKELTIYQVWHWDWIAGLLLCGLGTIGVVMVYHWHLWSEVLESRTSALSVGMVAREEGGVRLRPNESPIWHDIFDPQPVANGDTIFTGDDGVGELTINNESSVILSPRSLVVLQIPQAEDRKNWLEELFRKRAGQKNPSLRIKRGSVKVKLTAKARPMQVVAEDKVFQVIAATEKQATTISIAVDPENKVTPVQFRTEDAIPVNITPQSTGQKQTISLQKDEIAGVSSEGTLQIQSPVPQVTKAPTPVTVVMAPAPAAVAPVAKPSVTPETRVVQVSKVKLNTQLGDSGQTREMVARINWEPVMGASKYRIRFYQPNGKRVREQVLSKVSYDIKLQSPDEADFLYDIGAKVETGKWITSTRSRIELNFVAPEIRFPEPNAVFATGITVTLSWVKTKITRDYEVQIAKDPRFMNMFLSEKRKKNYFILEKAPAGVYYWRVKSTNGDRQSSWSTVGTFSVK